VRLFFVERIEGSTAVRRVVLDTYGAIPDWPRGFLDQAAREAQEILSAASRKMP
jgi:hypothetical protein